MKWWYLRKIKKIKKRLGELSAQIRELQQSQNHLDDKLSQVLEVLDAMEHRIVGIGVTPGNPEPRNPEPRNPEPRNPEPQKL